MVQLLVLLVNAAGAQDAELHAVRAQIGAVRERAGRLEALAVDQGILPLPQRDEMYDQALYEWMAGDPERAAHRLWLLRGAVPADDPLRPSIDDVLVQCLLAIDAWDLADEVLQEILATPGHPFARAAAARRLELYADHRSPDAFAAVFVELDGRGLLDDPPATLAYGIGRAWYALGELAAAEVAFEQVPSGGVRWWQARYHLGVVAVAGEDLGTAYARFHDLASQAPQTPTQRHIRDLAMLGLARVHHEQDELAAAAEVYRRIEGDSPVLPEALEELTWLEIERGFPHQARAAARRLVAHDPVAPATLRVQVLLGDLEMTLERWDAAQSAYAEAEAEVTAARKRLEQTDDWRQRLPGDVPLARAVDVSRSADEVGKELAAAGQDLQAVADALLRVPRLVRHEAHADAALALLASVAELRLGLAAASLPTSSPGRRRTRELRAQVAAAAAQPAPGVPQRDWVDERVRASDALLERCVAAVTPSEASRELAVQLADAEQTLRRILDRIDAEVATANTEVHRALLAERATLGELREAYASVAPAATDLTDRATSLARRRVQRELDVVGQQAALGAADAAWEQLAVARARHQAGREKLATKLDELDRWFASLRTRISAVDAD